ncbi:MAG: polysaccharide biosynthesis C-terminal domain-containing protein [Porphyromonadaceae bacterium]|nr:polysaccharide biosynthesis C-terminal domain-containing protein [Porphyromonadaceae bacterium]
MSIFSFIKNQINKGSERTVVIKKNIIGSFIIKGLSIFTSLMLVPLTLTMLDNEKYGIWITLYSIVNWFNIMDIGLGNGFRNKFAKTVAHNDYHNARKYIETIYSTTLIIAFVFFFLYSLIHPFLNWHKLLNISITFDEDITQIVFFVFGLFSLQLFLKNITTILLALQKTALSNLIMFLGNLLALATIIILSTIGEANLKTISLAFMLSPITVYLISTFFLFKKTLKKYTPSKFNIQREYISDMMNLGIKFFFIQITTIVMFSSGNFVIAQLFGPKEVTPYNISYRLFAATISIFTIIIAPFWSAYTEAITKNEFSWIKNALMTLNKIWLMFALGLMLILLLSPFVYKLWIGDQVSIPFFLSASFALYAALLSWSGMFAQFLNGVGKIRIQLYISIFQCISNIPLAIILAKYLNMGISGVIMATNINLLISAIILPIQVRKITNQNAEGIWNK